MPEKRMFAKSICLSDAFLDMSMTARCLYFTFGLLADDDGFIGNPRAIMRQCGGTDKDLKELLEKRYILAFETGVMAIKHWRINNYLRNDRYKETTYIEEKESLEFDEKGAYTEKGKSKNHKDAWKEQEAKKKKYKKKKAQLPDYESVADQVNKKWME